MKLAQGWTASGIAAISGNVNAGVAPQDILCGVSARAGAAFAVGNQAASSG